MRETERLAAEVSARVDALHCLVLSAGMVRGRRVLTSEGIESNFALGYLSRFVLVRRLAERIGCAAAPGILIVNGAARNGKIHYDDLNLTHNFGTLRAVFQLCEANDVLCSRTGAAIARRDRAGSEGGCSPDHYPLSVSAVDEGDRPGPRRSVAGGDAGASGGGGVAPAHLNCFRGRERRVVSVHQAIQAGSPGFTHQRHGKRPPLVGCEQGFVGGSLGLA